MLAPVQVVVLTVPDEAAGLEVLRALRGVGGGAVALLDAFVLHVDADGVAQVLGANIETSPPSAPLFLVPEQIGADTAPKTQMETDSRPDMWDLGQVVGRDATAVVAVLEHRWAEHLRDVLTEGRGAVRHEAWLDADDRELLSRLLDSADR